MLHYRSVLKLGSKHYGGVLNVYVQNTTVVFLWGSVLNVLHLAISVIAERIKCPLVLNVGKVCLC